MLEAFKSFEDTLNGEKDHPVHVLRKEALSRFNKMGFPTAKDEEWKYTDTSSISSKSFKLRIAKYSSTVNQEVIERVLLKECAKSALVFVDGIFSPQLSRWELAPQQIEFISLASNFNQYNQSTSLDNECQNAFTCLSTAFLRDGCLLRARKNISISTPVQLIFITTNLSDSALITPRVSIIAEEGASLEIVETHIADNARGYLSSALNEISISKNASVKYQRVELEDLTAFHIANVKVKQERDSSFSSNFFSFGGKLVRNEVAISIAGSGCHTEINGLTVIKQDQHVDNHTTLDHAQPHCQSVERFKGVYGDKSRGVFQGTIIVRPDAQKTNAIQSNQSILLSKDATIDTKPQLKIWADDVKCTHGATVGQLDENALFYIRSRGIEKEAARNMLVHAFASDLISNVPTESLRTLLEAELLNKLSAL